MRRQVVIVLCCLIAGAVVNTIVAWSCALWSGSSTPADFEMLEFDPEDRHRWHAETVSLISEETITFAVAESRSFGRSLRIAWTDPDFSLWKMRSRAGVVYDYTSTSWSGGGTATRPHRLAVSCV